MRFRDQKEVDALRNLYKPIDRIAEEYANTLKKLVRKMKSLMEIAFVERLSPLIQQYENEQKKITDNSVDDIRYLLTRYTNLINAEIEIIMIEIYRLFSPEELSVIVANFIDIVDEAQRAILLKELTDEYETIPTETYEPIDESVDEILEEKEKEEKEYIPIIVDEYKERVQTGIVEALQTGLSTAAIFALLLEWGENALNKAEFVAVNETGDLFDSLSQQRQTNIGIDYFVWLTQQDSRVRESHAELDGHVFKWAEGAVGAGANGQDIWPKSEYNCRCFAAAYFDDEE